jgi:Fe2+/Zn2+ uptake regulation proteins
MQSLKERIHSCGLKATPQRIAIYNSMRKLGHASADMLEEHLKSTFPSLTVATIYNVLESFVEVGLLVRRLSSNNKMYFDVNVYEHAHFYDEKKNSYMDYKDPELVKLVMDYLSTKDIPKFKIRSVDIQLVGEKVRAKSVKIEE